jgi:predicted ATPase/DNA-binding CsgD family transcriptional regulator
MTAAGSTSAVAGLATSRGRLPVARTSFVGREREVADVAELLTRDGARLVILTGPGGAGKTRVALRVAEEVGAHFQDGVVFVALTSVADAAHVLPTIARTFGVREAGSPLTRRLAHVLRNRHLLLLLDNFEHVLEAAPDVAEVLAGSGGVSLLITSRAPLRLSGEQEYPVTPLPVPEAGARPEQVAEAAAVRLFVERARAVDPAFAVTPDNAATIAAVCRRLDGLPLALELGAAKARLLPPEAVLARLEDRLPVLTGGARDQPVRLRTMRDAVAWSYDLLTTVEQALFRRLAVFVGGFDPEAAEAVAGELDGGGADLFALVEALVDQSLVRRVEAVGSTPRFGMLETIREFGLERLEAAGEADEVGRAHAAHYLMLAERAEPELLAPRPEAWLGRLTADHGNVAAALRFFATAGDDAAVARLAGALREYWYATGRWAEGRTWLDQVVSRAELPDAISARACIAAGFLAHYQGDDVDALPLLERGLALLRRTGDEREAAYAQYLLGVAAEDRGDYASATQLLTEATDRLRALGDITNAAYGEAHRGIVALGEGDPARAAAHGEAARALAGEAGSRDPAAVALLLLGDAARDGGDHAAAAERYAEHLRLIEASIDVANESLARAVASVAVFVAELRQPRRAATLLGASEQLRETLGLALALPERVVYERAAARVRDELGEAVFDRALAEGRLLAPGDVLAEIEHAVGLRPPAADVPDASAVGLSRRELEVLRLIADGRTNREIAGALFLSVRTVERHVTNLYAKIGARGRADATAFALRHGLG